MEEKINEKNTNTLATYLYILVKWRKFIIVTFIIVSTLTAIFTLIMPKTFIARAVILPPKGMDSDISSFLSNISLAGINFGGASDETNSFLAILKSRTIMESMIKQFNLIERYEVEDVDEALRALEKNIDVEIQEEATIAVSVKAQTGALSNDTEDDSVRLVAAEMTNFLLQELDRINKELKTTQARYHRIVIERRYNENKTDMVTAENEMKNFQEKYGVIALSEQLQAAITAAAELETQIVASEIKLRALSTSLSPDHPKILETKITINELKDALNKMKYGYTSDESSMSLYPAFKDAPELGIQFIQLKRELEVQNQIYEFLTLQYEQAKLQELKDTPTVQVLDEAVPIQRRASPKRALTVMVAGFMAIMVSCFFAFVLEAWTNMKKDNSEGYKKVKWIIEEIKSDLTLSKRKGDDSAS